MPDPDATATTTSAGMTSSPDDVTARLGHGAADVPQR